MIIEFLNEAEQELLDAVLWYKSKETDLGQRFRQEFGHGRTNPGIGKLVLSRNIILGHIFCGKSDGGTG